MIRPVAGTLAGAAAMVAVVTIAARVTGFGRWIVFAQTVEGGCLADVYNTANLLPNAMFEVVVGGALAGVVVPLLAAAVARGDREHVDRTVSALLTWATLLLVPVALLAAVLAEPLVRFFLGSAGDCPGAVAVGVRMLWIFLPQLFCYGVAVVLSGTLAAHRRFLAAALAPLMSSLVLIATYAIFAAMADGRIGTGEVSPGARDVLAAGTTLGVLALAATVAVPLRAAGIRIRPTLTFPSGVAVRARALAAAGAAVLVAHQGALLVVIWLANHHGPAGSVTAWTWALAVFLSAHAVLALPIVTSAFPRIAAAADPTALTAFSTRLVLLAGCAGAAVTIGAAVPIGRVFVAGTSVGDETALRAGIVALGPALLGFALVAHLSRVLYAADRGRAAAVAGCIGWAAVAGAGAVAVAIAPGRDAVAAIAAGYSIGLTVGGGLLLAAVVRLYGRAVLAGLARTFAAGILAGALAANVGRILGREFEDAGFLAAAAGATAIGMGTFFVFFAAVSIGDPATARALRRGGGNG
ncbi:MAG: murein biosynthesis integral membrane protein MurJ [Sporichthyaceae bacterium]